MRYLGIALVQAWRYTFGLLTPAGTCKYHPSCSQYALDAFRIHGLFKGSVFAGWRILRDGLTVAAFENLVGLQGDLQQAD